MTIDEAKKAEQNRKRRERYAAKKAEEAAPVKKKVAAKKAPAKKAAAKKETPKRGPGRPKGKVPPHGDYRRYVSHECRCKKCRAAWAAYYADWKARKKAAAVA